MYVHVSICALFMLLSVLSGICARNNGNGDSRAWRHVGGTAGKLIIMVGGYHRRRHRENCRRYRASRISRNVAYGIWHRTPAVYNAAGVLRLSPAQWQNNGESIWLASMKIFNNVESENMAEENGAENEIYGEVEGEGKKESNQGGDYGQRKIKGDNKRWQ